MYVKPSAITVMIDRLIDQELVERYHDKDDRRVVIIELTKKGKARVEEAMTARNEHIAKILLTFRITRKRRFITSL